MSAYLHERCADCATTLVTGTKTPCKCGCAARDKQWRYRKRITLPNGSKLRISGTPATNTKAAAEAAEHDHIERLLHPERMNAAVEQTLADEKPSHSMPTIRQFVGRFVKEYGSDGKAGSNRTRAVHLRGIISRFFGDLSLDGIDQSHVEGFKAAAKQAKRAAQTTRNQLYSLAAMLGYAAKLNIIPPHRLDLSVKGTSETKIEATMQPHIAKLLKVAKDPRWEVAIRLASECGLRIGEIRGLQWGDIKDDTITVRRAIDDRNQVDSPKWGRIRTVPMSPATKRALKKLPKKAIWVLTRLDDSEEGRKGQKRASAPGGFLGYSGVTKVIARLYREAGITIADNINPWHSLRHAYGTKLAGSNVPLSVVQQLMGHNDIRTTMRYVTTTEDQKAAAVARVFR